MNVLYFAWLKEKTGMAREDLPLPDGITDVSGLIEHLAGRGGGFADAFKDTAIVRVAVNQEHVGMEAQLSDNDEVAFFPPITGG